MTESDLAPYTGALLKPSAGRGAGSRGFTAEPAHYDGNHKALIFFGRQGISQTVTWGDGRAIHAELFPHVGRSQARRHRTSTLRLEHAIAGETVQTDFDMVDHSPPEEWLLAAGLLKDYLPGHAQRWEIVPLVLSGHHNSWAAQKIAEYAYMAADAIASPVRYNPHRLAVERLARSYVRDVLRWTSADDLTACDPIHEALPRAAVEQLAHGWSSWIHDCDRERGLEYCRARIAWLIGTELAHERHGLLALDMTHPHPLAQEIGRRYELGLPFESLFEALPH